MEPFLVPQEVEAFAEDARRAVYAAIELRRDVRHFRPGEPIPDEVLLRVLGAAHQAPSVGFSQPWGFVVVRDRERRARIRESFLRCRAAEALRFPPERREKYLAYQLEGILEAPVNVCVAVDLRLPDPVLGSTVQPEAIRASACCAVQNLWLVARAEGLGVGWVSIVEPAVLRHELGLPGGVEPVAYLCVGRPVAFRSRPMLEETGWDARRPLEQALHAERWTGPAEPELPRAPAATGAAIAPVSEQAAAAARAWQAGLAKPAGSLGRLEELAAFYAAARGVQPPPPLLRAAVAIFAADHGVAKQGVSAYGSQVTAGVVANLLAGRSGASALGRAHRVELTVVDVGVAGDLSALPRAPQARFLARKVRAGTRDFTEGPALTPAEVESALRAGEEVARELDADAAGLGEVGMANTTSAAALLAALLGEAPDALVGRGTGLADGILAHKRAVVRAGLRRNPVRPGDPLGALAAVGGLELAALAGFTLGCARRRLPVVVDGFPAATAALAAVQLEPAVRGYLVAAHRTPEPGSQRALDALGLAPLLELGLRLGEGTGAILGLSLLRGAVEAHLSLSTLAEAGIQR